MYAVARCCTPLYAVEHFENHEEIPKIYEKSEILQVVIASHLLGEKSVKEFSVPCVERP